MNQSLPDLIKTAILRGTVSRPTGNYSQRLDAAVRHVIADLRREGLLNEDRVRELPNGES